MNERRMMTTEAILAFLLYFCWGVRVCELFLSLKGWHGSFSPDITCFVFGSLFYRKVALGAAVAVNGGGGSSFKVEIFFFLLSVLRIGPLSVKYWEISGGDFLFWVLIHSLWRCSSAFCSLLSPFEKQEA